MMSCKGLCTSYPVTDFITSPLMTPSLPTMWFKTRPNVHFGRCTLQLSLELVLVVMTLSFGDGALGEPLDTHFATSF